MAFLYRIYKQLIPVPMNASDPTWAKRQVWVAKLNAIDTVDEFATLAEAQADKTAQAAADETGRVYKITKMHAPEVGTRPVITQDEEGNEVLPVIEDVQEYMEANAIEYIGTESVEELLELIEEHWGTPDQDIE
jgi:hypothetical protein